LLISIVSVAAETFYGDMACNGESPWLSNALPVWVWNKVCGE
jgi:hypothetical protein